ncbi:MAG TPA: efflux RND transporter periplasmic adaptor subunit [Gemmataceae bacterium]|nr:efflux RND transporter periplasmic adaptor subunit [Gemmataceae bacterium]
MRLNKTWTFRLSAAGATVAGVGLLILLLGGRLAGHEPATPTSPVSQSEDEGGEAAIAVTTIKPKRDPDFAMTYTVEPADVEPYYETNIEAQAAGPVAFIRKATGSPIKKGETLLKIAVPDRDAALARAKEIVTQKNDEVELARTAIDIAQAAVVRADKDIELRKQDLAMAKYVMDWRHRELQRVREMATGDHPAITAEMLDEQIEKTGAADAGYASAQQAVEKAKADHQEMLARLKAARADLKLKQTLVRVAERDRDLAQAMVDYATVKAPYDGEIKSRDVDPGSLVQNASNGSAATPLLKVQTTTIVTVVVRLPDRYAPYITLNTDAMIELSDLPGLVIRGKVTRRTPSLLNPEHDRTMEVKVDIFNGTAGDYQKWLAAERKKAVPFEDVRDGPLPQPLYPRDSRPGDPGLQRLMPGMIGKMTLVLKRFKNSYLIPSSAIVKQGGTPYVYLVKDGVAHLQEVKVLVNDQRLAKVALVETSAKGTATRPLTGKEEIVYTGQGELSDGTPVKTNLQDWHR